LSLFSKFEKLNFLKLANNYFYGSLKPLENVNDLKVIDIRITDIDSGIEYLPKNLEEIYCVSEQKSEARVQKIVTQLHGYGKDGKYDLQAWKEDNINNSAQKLVTKIWKVF
jgi:hypothetical protein